MSNIHIPIVFFSLAVFCVGCTDPQPQGGGDNVPPNNVPPNSVPPSSASVDIAHVAKNFKSLKSMTPAPVFVNPELAMLCIGASKEMVDDARKEKGPHAHCSVNIFMNDMAAVAFEGDTSYPAGSVIVKEKQMLGFREKTSGQLNGTSNGVGGMIKREDGFDSGNGNWEYFYVENDAEIEFGKLESCIQCHSKVQQSDYVYGSWASHDEDDNPNGSGY